jgi:hypothetical protein
MLKFKFKPQGGDAVSKEAVNEQVEEGFVT